MQIEILTRKVELKNRFLTRYARDPNLWAAGDTVKIPGLEMRIAENYLLFNISSAGLAEEVIPLLFTVTPVSTAGQLYEPAADMKIIVTARSKNPAELLPHMHEVSHLDLERGEILGERFTEWRSRNVYVTSRAALAVQGNILVAKIKFSTHSRDSQFNCQACVDRVSLSSILEPLSPDFTAAPPEPLLHGPVIEAHLMLSGEGWAELINRRPAPVTYCPETNRFKIVFSNAGHISFYREPDRQEITCRVQLADPAVLDNGLLGMLRRLLGMDKMTVTHRAENLLLPPDYLVSELGFGKERDFHLFSLTTDLFTGVYDVNKLELTLQRSISTGSGESDVKVVQETFTGMVEFMNKVMSRAGSIY